MKYLIKKLFLLGILVSSTSSIAQNFETPKCYQNVPVTCGFDDMTLSLCNSVGKEKFSIENRTHIPGGNIFSNSKKTCTVTHIQNTEPAQYSVSVK